MPTLKQLTHKLPEIPAELSALLRAVTRDFPAVLKDNLIGIYLWGSLTYDAFDRRCSDVDAVVVTRRYLSRTEFAALARWFRRASRTSSWVKRLDMRFVIDNEFFDRKSRCCGFYPYTGKLVRHGSDGNPIIWLNVGRCGITLWGKEAKTIAPAVSGRRLNDALLLELDYLSEDLTRNAGSRSVRAFRHNAYAVLTACRILYTALHRVIVPKDTACEWAIASLPAALHPAVVAARANRLRNHGTPTRGLERSAADFVRFARGQVQRGIGGYGK